ANAVCVMPSGFRNSSSSISPGGDGGACVGKRRSVSGNRSSASMVVDDFDIVCIPILPSKANPVLGVDPDAELAAAIADQPLQTVSRRNVQLPQVGHPIQLRQFP